MKKTQGIESRSSDFNFSSYSLKHSYSGAYGLLFLFILIFVSCKTTKKETAATQNQVPPPGTISTKPTGGLTPYKGGALSAPGQLRPIQKADSASGPLPKPKTLETLTQEDYALYKQSCLVFSRNFSQLNSEKLCGCLKNEMIIDLASLKQGLYLCGKEAQK